MERLNPNIETEKKYPSHKKMLLAVANRFNLLKADERNDSKEKYPILVKAYKDASAGNDTDLKVMYDKYGRDLEPEKDKPEITRADSYDVKGRRTADLKPPPQTTSIRV